MSKIIISIVLFAVYVVYSMAVYTHGTETAFTPIAEKRSGADRGKILFQNNNCISCHQIYGLGGYLGPELTTAWSDKYRGEAYMKAFLKNGGTRMPKFNFTDDEIKDLLGFLQYVDFTAITYKNP